jgi:hypothetical protein
MAEHRIHEANVLEEVGPYRKAGSTLAGEVPSGGFQSR